MNKLEYIQSLRVEDTITLRSLVRDMWLLTDSFGEFLMMENSKERLSHIINSSNVPACAMEHSLKDGSYREDDTWIGIWNDQIYSMCDADYHHWLLEVCFNSVFRTALIDYTPILLKNRDKFPDAVIQYVVTNQIENNNEENRKCIKRVVHLPKEQF